MPYTSCKEPRYARRYSTTTSVTSSVCMALSVKTFTARNIES